MDLSEVTRILMLLLVFSFEHFDLSSEKSQDPKEFNIIPVLLIYVANVHRAHADIMGYDRQKHKIVQEDVKMVDLEMNGD